jgi:hypothetical protein
LLAAFTRLFFTWLVSGLVTFIVLVEVAMTSEDVEEFLHHVGSTCRFLIGLSVGLGSRFLSIFQVARIAARVILAIGTLIGASGLSCAILGGVVTV